MKKILIILVSIFFVSTICLAEETTEEKTPPGCPTTNITDNNKCMFCHAMQKDENGKPFFGLKEINPKAKYADTLYFMHFVKDTDGNLVPYAKIEETGSQIFRDLSEFIYSHPEFQKVIIELHTPGGSVMDAWRAVGIIGEMQKRGIIVEIRCYGMAASAGVILLASGSIGHRFINPHAEIMMHKLWTFSMFDLKTPDTSEDQTATLNHFQENLNSFLIERSNLTAEKIEEMIFKRDFWFTGAQAVEFGLADAFVQ